MELKDKIQTIQNLIRTQNLPLAVSNCKKLLKKHPQNSYILNLCGLASQGDKKFSNSIEFFTKALHYEPENLAAMNNLANTFKHLNKLEKAQELYLKVIKKDPNNIKVLNNYGNLKQSLNDFEGAINLYIKALELNKNDINILFSLAASYQSIGELETAKNVISKILILNPKNTSAHKMISGFTNYKENPKHLNDLENLLKNQDLSEDQKIDLHFALGKAYEDQKKYKESFDFLQKANYAKKIRSNYKISTDEKVFSNIIKTFESLDFNKFSKISGEKEIIFICGMPRSGTTLVEQIIASHKEVSGAGELIYLQNVLKKNFFESSILNKQKIIEKGLSKANIIEKEYIELLELHNFSSNKITDKAPQNFRWIGFMKIFFPSCKIIHCSRDPKDNCLSLFKNSFASSDMAWAHDQIDTAQYYKLYTKIMNFWKLKLSSSIYNVKYESIVNNPEEEIKKLLKFCKLEWDPDCLNFHKKKKTPIQTVSVAQARKPIYKTSINSNTGYSEYLKSMYDILDTN